MPRRPLLIIAATCACLAGALLGPEQLRVPLALVLLTVLPGAAFAELLLGRSRDSGAERWLVTLALSFATLIVGGLILDGTVGITKESVVGLAVGVSIVVAIAALVVNRLSPGESLGPRGPRTRVSILDGVIFAAAAALVVVAIAYARTPLPARGVQGYTVLWITPNDTSLTLGVKSQELEPMQYRLDVRNGSQLIRSWQIRLAPGQDWDGSVARQPGAAAIEGILYVRRAGTWGVYRTVRAVQ